MAQDSFQVAREMIEALFSEQGARWLELWSTAEDQTQVAMALTSAAMEFVQLTADALGEKTSVILARLRKA